ncbi:hypothetical protein E2C01_089358 [Portunus trituberculatus]|uniref:Uncharacterized protein n=1 Tax=Portunus trituberculatus TaxID=210409 RepID=A0A5B7JDB8_PORTR|nr:hypothetical protein [Portunus trituberculatus]
MAATPLTVTPAIKNNCLLANTRNTKHPGINFVPLRKPFAVRLQEEDNYADDMIRRAVKVKNIFTK